MPSTGKPARGSTAAAAGLQGGAGAGLAPGVRNLQKLMPRSRCNTLVSYDCGQRSSRTTSTRTMPKGCRRSHRFHQSLLGHPPSSIPRCPRASCVDRRQYLRHTGKRPAGAAARGPAVRLPMSPVTVGVSDAQRSSRPRSHPPAPGPFNRSPQVSWPILWCRGERESPARGAPPGDCRERPSTDQTGRH